MRFGKKLAVFFWVSTVTMAVVTVTLFSHEAQSTMRKEAESRLADVVMNASRIIDPVAHVAAEQAGNQESPEYQSIKESFERFREANPGIRHVYTLVSSGKPSELSFVVDVGVDPPINAANGCPWNIERHSAIRDAFTETTIDPTIRTDQWGSWLSGFAPVRNADNRVVAMVGIDMSVTEILSAQTTIRRGAAMLIAAAIILASFLSLVVNAGISNPVARLTNAMLHIADGDLDYSSEISRNDELGTMAVSLDRMAANLRESQANLLQKANTDGLTGLTNHRNFHEKLDHELKRALRYSRPLSLIMIDLDGFKAINDNLGHPAGDTILRCFSRILREEIRDTDIAARYGGDEFAVILPETEVEEATGIAERIRAAVDQGRAWCEELPTDTEDEMSAEWKITLSVGVAEYPTHARQKDALVSAADIAMYHAKHLSQNAVCTYDNVPGAGSAMDPCRIYAFLQSASVNTIAALATAVDAKDHYTHGHSESVARYAVGIAAELGFSEEVKFSVRVAALLHDVGKIGMPDTVLNNPGQLNEQEWDIVRNHPSVGERIVQQVPQLRGILPGILYHHERFDGTGYPCGLAGENIPIIARIICVADAFDAMTSSRPYREAMTMGQAIEELRNYRGTQFDPQCVDALIQWIRSVELKVA